MESHGKCPTRNLLGHFSLCLFWSFSGCHSPSSWSLSLCKSKIVFFLLFWINIMGEWLLWRFLTMIHISLRWRQKKRQKKKPGKLFIEKKIIPISIYMEMHVKKKKTGKIHRIIKIFDILVLQHLIPMLHYTSCN